ncbi:PUA domain-containing protein, partial [uncultured Halovibrio sp.]
AARSGAFTLIAGGRMEAVLTRARAGEPVGTLLVPDQERLDARKQWMAGHLRTRGRLVLDAGAVRVLTEGGRSLLPVGVRRVEGAFRRGEMVSCVDEQGREVARGLVSYDAAEARQLVGCPSEQIAERLGYLQEEELIHRDNMVLV